MQSFNFTKGLIYGFLAVFIPLLLMQLILMQVGELSLDYILERQMQQKDILFSSGINQNAYEYKFALQERINPKVMVVGSSRAMQVRKEFIRDSYVNLGGAVSNVSDLEAVAQKIKSEPKKPELVILFIDPWWFNERYHGASETHADAEFPSVVNMGVIISALKSFERGNWLKPMWDSNYLGIHALLTEEGYARDGSYHYVKTVTGMSATADVRFSKTLNRIDGNKQRFEKNKSVSIQYVKRACSAIKLMKQNIRHLVLVEPPFANKVWQKMQQSGYEYIEQLHQGLSACTENSSYYDFTDPLSLSADDCEFVDGFHGGDTVSARMLMTISNNSSELGEYINTHYIHQFLTRYSGYAAGLTMGHYSKSRETDFLKLGCKK